MADWIWMPFGVVSGIGGKMSVLDGVERDGQFRGMWDIPL